MMFGYISKRKLKAYMEEIKRCNRAECNGANHDLPMSVAQKTKNVYAQGYEDGTDNFYNAVCHKFKIERKFTSR